MILNCPLPDQLTEIPVSACPFMFDQIVRMGFQRRQPLASPTFATLAAMQGATAWDTLKAAEDDTKLVMSPIFTGFVIPESEAQTVGGNDNSTFAGIREYNGEGAVTVTGQFKNLAPATMRALEMYSQESLASALGVSNLTVFLFNRNGNVFAINPPGVDGETPTTTYRGIPVYNFRISSPGSAGFNAPNTNGFSFDLPADWGRFIASVRPTFDPLAEL